MSKFFVVLLIIVILALISGGVYGYWYFNQRLNDQSKTIDDLKSKLAEEAITKETTEDSTKLTQTYRSQSSGFEISYLTGWTASEAPLQQSEEGTVETVYFKDSSGKTIVTVSVQPTSMEGMLKESFEIKQTTTVTIDSVNFQKLSVLDNQSGKEMIYYLAKKGGKLYTFSAKEADATTLEKMVNSFKFPTS